MTRGWLVHDKVGRQAGGCGSRSVADIQWDQNLFQVTRVAVTVVTYMIDTTDTQIGLFFVQKTRIFSFFRFQKEYNMNASIFWQNLDQFQVSVMAYS